MKLATVNPHLDLNIEHLLSKEVSFFSFSVLCIDYQTVLTFLD